jgi:hypothetical protein
LVQEVRFNIRCKHCVGHTSSTVIEASSPLESEGIKCSLRRVLKEASWSGWNHAGQAVSSDGRTVSCDILSHNCELVVLILLEASDKVSSSFELALVVDNLVVVVVVVPLPVVDDVTIGIVEDIGVGGDVIVAKDVVVNDVAITISEDIVVLDDIAVSIKVDPVTIGIIDNVVVLVVDDVSVGIIDDLVVVLWLEGVPADLLSEDLILHISVADLLVGEQVAGQWCTTVIQWRIPGQSDRVDSLITAEEVVHCVWYAWNDGTVLDVGGD